MLIFTKEELKVWWNLLNINNAKLAIITDPIRIIGFFGAADFTEHINYPSSYSNTIVSTSPT